MSYSKYHADKNPLSPGRVYGLSSSATENKPSGKVFDVMHGQDDYNITHYVTEKGHGMTRMTPKKGYNKETGKFEGLQPIYTMLDQSNPKAFTTSMTKEQFIDNLSRGKKTSKGRLKFHKMDERPNLVITGGTKGFDDIL